ncbi:hypothetical protein [Paraburkholderia metrosideri]|nr:hypothetical protein [Paraburkholderia metrosideri]
MTLDFWSGSVDAQRCVSGDIFLIRITVDLDWMRELSECGAEERG